MSRIKKNYNDIIAFVIIIFSIIGNSVLSEFNFFADINYFFNLQYLLIYFFSFNRFKYLSLLTLFFLGLINDSLIGISLGISSVAYMTIYKIAIYQQNIKLRSIFISEWAACGLSIAVAYSFVLTIFFFQKVSFDYLQYFYNFLGSFVIYPLLWIILKYCFLKIEKFENE